MEHLRELTAGQRGIVLDTVTRQLEHEPDVAIRNRKPLRPNPLAPWELSIGDLRVYYEVTSGPEAVVSILAVGIREHERVRIGGEVIEL